MHKLWSNHTLKYLISVKMSGLTGACWLTSLILSLKVEAGGAQVSDQPGLHSKTLSQKKKKKKAGHW
jgi:hypothetical protein